MQDETEIFNMTRLMKCFGYVVKRRMATKTHLMKKAMKTTMD